LGTPSQQLQIFPRKSRIEYPPVAATAESIGYVEADDRFLYYVKSDKSGKPVRASEWLCTHLAEAVGISAPAPAIIEMQSGDLVFGSRRIARLADAVSTTTFLTTPSATNVANPIAGLGSVLSSIYSLDMFVHNVDRHYGNYISIDDNGVRRLYAFDFSHAMFCSWPLTSFPAVPTHTRTHGSFLRQAHGFDATTALTVVDRLGGLAFGTVEGFINQMPSDWLSSSVRAAFMQFWSAGARSARLDGLRKGLIDGTLL
jgi:hypothetical protein